MVFADKGVYAERCTSCLPALSSPWQSASVNRALIPHLGRIPTRACRIPTGSCPDHGGQAEARQQPPSPKPRKFMKNYYAIELEYLRELGAEYAREHPAIAPLLATRSTDPDVERLLEGTAFLCGLINERLDQNFPEVIQAFLDITAPELLRPSPSQTLIQFQPLPQVQGVQTLAAGSALESTPVSGISCTYTIPREQRIVPVTSAVSLLEDRSPDAATLHLRLRSSAPLAAWWTGSLQLHLHDELSRACQWFYLLLNKCTRIRLEAAGTVLSLSPDALVPDIVARDPAEAFAASGSGTSSPLPGSLSAAWLRNYFILPEQFLFLRLEGGRRLSRTENAHQLDIFFRLQDCRDLPAHLAPDLLRCNVSWAINLFAHSSDPFILNQNRQEYRLVPHKDPGRTLEIYTIRRVTGLKRGLKPHVYEPYTRFSSSPQTGTYVVRRARSPVNGRMDLYISLLYAGNQGPQAGETLSSELLCFQHTLPLQLREGDISQATDSSPAMATFSNIVPPTPPFPAPDSSEQQWRLFSSLHANMLSLADAKALKEFLTLWLPVRDPDPTHATLNRQRIEAVQDFEVRQEERLFRGRPLRGLHLLVRLNGDCFARAGDRYLFGLILNEVLSRYATINTCTRLEVQDTRTGESLTWMPRLGSRRLL